MSDLEGYKSWLAQLQDQSTFKNNYWCAMLSKEMEENSGSEGLKVPYFIVERELMKNAETSVILTRWIEHLLKTFHEEVNATNCEEVLRDFLESANILPADVTCPLTDSISFHSLPAECKLWILYALRTYNKPPRDLQKIAKDPLSNTYYIIPDCRLYVKIGKPIDSALSIDEEELKEQPWESLYRFVHAEQWILLSENQDEWEKVWKKFLSFKLNNLYNSLNPDMKFKLCEQNAKKMHNNEEEQAKVLQEEINKLNINAGNLNDPSKRTLKEKKSKNQTKKRRERCRDFPVCKNRVSCPYVHPNTPCNKFPNCPFGWRCTYLHETCHNDLFCEEPNCPYEHYLSTTTYYRISRDSEAVHRPVASVHPVTKDSQIDENIGASKEGSLVRGASMSSLSSSISLTMSVARNDDSEEYFSADSSSRRPADPKVQKWCSFLRFCKYKATTCKYKHPSEKCKKFPECPNGGVCTFLHEVCENDGVCSKGDCDYEHDLPHEISNRWCKYGSRCNKFGCKFIHPKECVGVCPAPNGCWMYHPPRPAFAPGPVFPGAPGFYPPQQPLIRYGFGPDSTYRPAPFPPGPGFNPGAGRGFPRGNMRGSGYQPRTGGFGPRQGGQPPLPRSRTPGRVSSPPSPTPSQSSEADRDFYERRKRLREPGY